MPCSGLKTLDLRGATALEGADNIALFLRVKTRRKGTRPNHVTKHDGELATLGRGRR
jgi:hypothetical protein